ncbi:MAG: hypothetical protein ACRCXA_13965 [Peptostreptococcaceae bacterium]
MSNNFYQLNCPHCGQFIDLNLPAINANNLTNNFEVFADENLGNISISNSYKNSGSCGTYEAMDIEMICPHCNYTFKSTVHSNHSL